MIHPNTTFWRSIGTMVGGIVGVGVFGIPYTFAQSGFLPGMLMLIVIAVLITILQLMLSEVVLQTTGRYRLVGYIRRYLGNFWAWIAMVILAISFWGAMTAYIIIGGKFLSILLSPIFGGPMVAYSLVVAGIAAILMYRGIHFVSKIEVMVVALLLFLFAFMTIGALPHLAISNLAFVDSGKFFAPYGVLIFALAGMGLVPEMKSVLGKQRALLPHAVMFGMLVITLLYAFFSFGVVGVTGTATTEAAFDGLIPVLGPVFGFIGSLLGTITILSIFSILGIELQNMLHYDFRVPKFNAWVLASAVPILLFLAGLQEFIELIGFVGGVLIGLIGILVVVTYEKMSRSPICTQHTCFRVSPVFSFALVILFILGMIFQMSSLF